MASSSSLWKTTFVWMLTTTLLSTSTTTTTTTVYAFTLSSTPCKTNNKSRNNVRLFGISEWRDQMLQDSEVLLTEKNGGSSSSGSSSTASSAAAISAYNDEYDAQGNLLPAAREMCVLPFPYEDVLLQGETKELRLYEDRFIKLFDECISKHCGVVAMGLLAESGIIQTAPLCEIEAYNRMEGFGIFVTIRVVGRVSLLELTQQEPYIKAICRELTDKIPANLELPNMVAGNIENFMLLLSSMQFQLNEATEAAAEAEVSTSSSLLNTYDEDDDFDDDDEDDDEENMDRSALFREAYKIAKATDTQGYTISSSSTTQNSSPKKENERSAQDLTAISWAAFSSYPKHHADDESRSSGSNAARRHDNNNYHQHNFRDENINYRIQALDMDDLFERLKLASYMLREEKAEMQAKLALAGLKYIKRNNNEDESSSDLEDY